MTRKSSIIFALFILMVALNFAINSVLSGGSDAKIIGGAIDHLRQTRGFVGAVSATIPSQSELTVSGELAVLSAAGRFFIPEGKTLVGAFNVSDGEVFATNSLVDLVVPGDGKLYARDHGLGSTPVGASFGLVEGNWVETEASVLWAEPSDKPIDSAALWNSIFDTATSREYLAVVGRALSENVAGVPTWHFLLGVTPDGAFRIGKAFSELKLGRALEPHEQERLRMVAQVAQPHVDVWINKTSGQLRQAALTYLRPVGEAIDKDNLESVVVTFNISEYPEWEPISAPDNFVSIDQTTEPEE